MHKMLVPVLGFSLIAASDAPRTAELPSPIGGIAAQSASMPVPGPEAANDDLDTEDENCSDRIRNARAAANLPPLIQREPASPDQPFAIYAVDRRQDGCSVMVMMGNPDDIRPLPLPGEGPVAQIPAEQAPAAGQ